METTISTSPFVAVSITVLLVSVLAVAILFALGMKYVGTWREVTTVYVMRTAFALSALALSLVFVSAILIDNESAAAVDTLEADYGVTELTPIGDDAINGCSFPSSSASAAAYTWVSADGTRQAGIFAKSENKGGSCVYTLTPASDS